MATRTRTEMGTLLNPFDVSNAYGVTMWLALGLAVLPGLGTGLLLVLIAGERLPVPMAAAWSQLAQAHGQIQALGFVLLFILAVGLQLFPRFLGAPLVQADRAVWGALLIAAALLLRLIGQPLAPGIARTVTINLATVGLPVGVVLAASAFRGLTRRLVLPSSGPSPNWSLFIVLGALSLGAALLLYIWAGLQLAGGNALVAENLDEALIHLELAGFATCVAFGVASRIFFRFLQLRTRPAFEQQLPTFAVAWGIGLVVVATSWLINNVWLRSVGSAVELCALVAWLWSIGLYAPASGDSGTPRVTNPTRRWIRLAFAFLVLSLVLDIVFSARSALSGSNSLTTELSAARHALAQGFLLPLMAAMASRLLPVFAASAMRRPWLIELLVDLLLVGALIRVGAEAVAGYTGAGGHFVTLGGTIAALAFTVFAVWLGRSLGTTRVQDETVARR